MKESAPTPKRLDMRSSNVVRCRAILALGAVATAVACHRPPDPPADRHPAPAVVQAPPPVTLPAENPRDVTLNEYAKMCRGEDPTGCERACDRGDAASCTSMGWLYD